MDVRVEPTPESAASLAAAWIVRRLRSAVRARGIATIAFSGGETPRRMIAEIARADLPWDRVSAFQVDERVAPDGHPDRNAPLLDSLPLPARQVAEMGVTSRDLRAAARRYAARLPTRLDVVHLGIGDDGHTASWPPGDPVIDSDRAVALSGEYQGRVRMTLTPPVVNAARSRIVLVVGATKAAAVSRWLGGDGGVPISRIRRLGTTIVLDASAAAGERHSTPR